MHEADIKVHVSEGTVYIEFSSITIKLLVGVKSGTRKEIQMRIQNNEQTSPGERRQLIQACLNCAKALYFPMTRASGYSE